jgi:hypothetical protein
VLSGLQDYWGLDYRSGPKRRLLLEQPRGSDQIVVLSCRRPKTYNVDQYPDRDAQD